MTATDISNTFENGFPRNTATRSLFVAGLLLSTLAFRAFANDVSVSGADSRMVGITGKADIYVVATDSEGRSIENLEAEDFVLWDAVPGEDFIQERPITGFSKAGERRNGLNFLLLIDDSGSMYDGPDGSASPAWELSRAAMARREASHFIGDLGNSMDKAGLALFGTRYRVLASPRTDRGSLVDRLGVSSVPERTEAYTELYAAIVESSKTMSSQRGRRIIILFSDGENYPFAEKSGELHPDYGMRKWTPDEALEALRSEAVTLYAVRFGANKDDELKRVAQATGGLVFDVQGEEGLQGLYSSIRDRVLAEYRISYRPKAADSDETRVRIAMAGAEGFGEIGFPSPLVFGGASIRPKGIFALLAIIPAVLLFLVMAKLKSASGMATPNLERLRPVGGGAATVALAEGVTQINPGVGGAATTIAPKNSASPVASGGTIIVEKGRDGKWKASGAEGVVVNNKRSDSTILSNGDVIKAGDELIVFDDGES